MRERDGNTESELDITSENLPEWRNKMAVLREQKGEDFKALTLVRKIRKAAEGLESHEDVVNAYWEEYLIGKHLLMQARDEAKNPFRKGILGTYGFYLMRTSSKEALKYTNEHNVDSLKPRTHRFLGEVDMFSRRYDSAVSHFQEGIKLFEKVEDPTVRWNALEFSGFLAEALVLSGKTEAGITLTKETFVKYDEGDGLLMKEASYYQWAVWKSGCIAKLWNAILIKKVSLDETTGSELKNMLFLGESLLVFLDGSEEKGGLNFNIRKAEFARLKKEVGLN
jgi:hypothetical protein